MASALNCILWLAAAWPAVGEPKVSTFSVYTDKMYLRPGEVFNKWMQPVPLPDDIVQQFAGKTLHLKGMQLDIVTTCPVTGEERSLPLSDVYNHHQSVILGPTEQLMRFYNGSAGHDPLSPDKVKKKASLNLRELKSNKDHHSDVHSGCMMNGERLTNVLEEVNALNVTGKVAGFGSASGAEFRGTSTDLAMPYTRQAGSPESIMALIHFLNMQGAPQVSDKRFECPCTSARKIDVANGTIDGQRPIKFECSKELLFQKNPACSLETYQGGYRCCEHGVFLTEEVPGPEAPVHEFQAKYTFTYYEEDLADAQFATLAKCCDATGNLTHDGNIEYSVPQCAPGTPPEMCEHVVTSVQSFSKNRREDPDEVLELVHAWGHQHVGGIGMELWNEQTGQLICRTKPQYGSGATPGDEAGFLVGIPPCVWGPAPLPPPPRLRRRDLLRTVSRYNSSEARGGVMALWLLTAALPKKPGMFV